MNIASLARDTLNEASAGIARSIVEISEIQAEIKFTEPFVASRLGKQINRLKTVLKDVEKLRH